MMISATSGFFTSSQANNCAPRRPLFQRTLCTTLLFLNNNSNNNDINSNLAVEGILNRRNILKALSGAVISIPILLEAYARIGSIQTDIDIDVFQSSDEGVLASPSPPPRGSNNSATESSGSLMKDVREVTIIFHGAGGQDVNTDELLKALSNTNTRNRGGIVKMVDWSADSADILQASVKGSTIGTRMANALLRNHLNDDSKQHIQTIHVIGISVGAFPANSFLQTLNEGLQNRNKAYLQLTLLDPFQQKAVLGVGYGNQNFGKGADYAQQFLNTDDPVPSTNEPLQYCSTVDVTSLRPGDVFGHDWPLVYYAKMLKEGSSNRSNGIVPLEERREIGSLEVL